MSCPGRFNLGNKPSTHCKGEWLGPPGPAWTTAEYLTATGIRSQDRRARSQSVYRPAKKGSGKWNFKLEMARYK